MPFVKVHKARMGTPTGNEPVVTMGAYLADGTVHKGRSVAFRMTYPLVLQLGWPLKDGKIGLGVLEGTGSDQGYLQIVVDEQNGYRASQGSKDREGHTYYGLAISLTTERFKHYILNECPVTSSAVNHIVDGDTLIIECPDWFRFNPQSVSEPELKLPKVEELKRPLPRANSVDRDDELHLNRRERRAIAQQVTRVLKR